MLARKRIPFIVGALLVPAALTVLGGPPATANHCPEIQTRPDNWCHETERPPTPKPPPTQPPTAPPTQPPAQQTTPVPTRRPTPKPTTKPRVKGTTVTPEPEATPIEITPDPYATEEPSITPEIVVTTPIPEETPENLAAERTAAGSSAGWAWFLVGFVLGGFFGLLASGMMRKRRKKQAIFG